MDFVKNRSDLLANAAVLDSYLYSDDSEKKIFAKDLIRHGHCFMLIKKDGEIHFYPSRFMGYLCDTKEKYEESKKEKKNPEKEHILWTEEKQIGLFVQYYTAHYKKIRN